jgi:hypothetical protein
MLESKRFPRETHFPSGLETKETENYTLYAPPAMVWSPWYKITPLTIPAQVTVSAEPLVSRGQNEFQIEVRYFDENSRRQIRNFSVLRKITFNAGNPDPFRPDAQVITVRLRSSLTGQNIRVRVDWFRRS